MTHAEWVRTRAPEAPSALVARIDELLHQHPEWDPLARTEALVTAAEALLRRALRGDPMSRSAAVDLLAADACVTYAFEAASDEPASIGGRAEASMRRIALAAAEHP